MKLTLKQESQIKKLLQKQGVILAYIFGSFVKDKAGPLSDFDIAILFSSEKVKEEDYFDRKLKISLEIDRIIGADKTEVICLNKASSLLKHRAVFQGIPIFVGNSKLKRDFELQILQEYEDFKYHLEIAFQIMRKQIQEGSFGKPLISPYRL